MNASRFRPKENARKAIGFITASGPERKHLNSITADLGDNACKVPFAPDYIRKAQDRGAIGKKRKTVKC